MEICVSDKEIDLYHPAESSENIAICGKIRKYLVIECIWQKLSQPHFHEVGMKIHGKSEESQIMS